MQLLQQPFGAVSGNMRMSPFKLSKVLGSKRYFGSRSGIGNVRHNVLQAVARRNSVCIAAIQVNARRIVRIITLVYAAST